MGRGLEPIGENTVSVGAYVPSRAMRWPFKRSPHYYPDTTYWLPGDMMLFSDTAPLDFISRTIRRQQEAHYGAASVWTHAAIYLGDGNRLVDADFDNPFKQGVSTKFLEEYCGSHRILVRRYVGPDGKSDERRRRIKAALTASSGSNLARAALSDASILDELCQQEMRWQIAANALTFMRRSYALLSLVRAGWAYLTSATTANTTVRQQSLGAVYCSELVQAALQRTVDVLIYDQAFPQLPPSPAYLSTDSRFVDVSSGWLRVTPFL